jgi:microsomal dipeptidase-like Zn-dependent dipeptidase
VVTSPAQAREVIADGKMAVVLGIETSNLFDCFLVPSDEFPACTEQDVIDKLDDYHARGVRALFPVHKYDNGFSAGDGNKQIIELGNWIQTGHFSNFTTECDPDTPTVFDRGAAGFPGLIEPRDDYFAPPPNDLSGFSDDPVGTLLPFLPLLLVPETGEAVCQAAGVTDLGEFLVEQMMQRGMILEIDHMPRRSYRQVFDILEQNDYPAAGTHGINNSGRLYALGGVSKAGFGRCRSETESATVDDGYQSRIALIEDNGGFPAEGFGLDLNGFAGAPGPRFGPNSGCGGTQEDPVTYPFTSYAGDVSFSEPWVGDRPIDFNTEGLVHVGLLPELIEDIRGDGVTDAELEPLFKSAEGYIRMWERAERRGAELRGDDALPEEEADERPWSLRRFIELLFSFWRHGR